MLGVGGTGQRCQVGVQLVAQPRGDLQRTDQVVLAEVHRVGQRINQCGDVVEDRAVVRGQRLADRRAPPPAGTLPAPPCRTLSSPDTSRIERTYDKKRSRRDLGGQGSKDASADSNAGPAVWRSAACAIRFRNRLDQRTVVARTTPLGLPVGNDAGPPRQLNQCQSRATSAGLGSDYGQARPGRPPRPTP